MAYQNVGTPRFYINIIEWLTLHGGLDVSWAHAFDFRPPLLDTLPVKPTPHPPPQAGEPNPNMRLKQDVDLYQNAFVALLGWNFASSSHYTVWTHDWNSSTTLQSVINGGNGESAIPSFRGFSISTFEETSIRGLWFEGDHTIGSIIFGSYFDMPHSPDLKLTMTRESGGTKSFRSQNGSSFSNSFYTRPPMWGDAAPWELYSETPTSQEFARTSQELARSGRRVWDLSFSYLSDSSLFSDTSSLSRAGEPGYNFDSNYLDNTLLNDYNFYSMVLLKTNGGELPFIFQPDKNDNTQFAICRFDMSTFKFTQVANGVYNIKLKIREVW